jgi:hypothetical protein
MSSSESQRPDEETVTAVYELAQRLVEDERARGRTLDQKASTFAAFTAAMLTLAAALGPDMLDADLGRVGEVAIRVAFVISVVALAAASALSVAGVLRPQARLAIATDEVTQLAGAAWLVRPASDVHGNMLVTLTESFKREREVNDRKARLTAGAVRALVVAIGALTTQAAILAIAL